MLITNAIAVAILGLTCRLSAAAQTFLSLSQEPFVLSVLATLEAVIQLCYLTDVLADMSSTQARQPSIPAW